MKTNRVLALAAVVCSPLCLVLATIAVPKLGLLLLIFALPLAANLFLFWAAAAALIAITGFRVADGTGQYIFL